LTFSEQNSLANLILNSEIATILEVHPKMKSILLRGFKIGILEC